MSPAADLTRGRPLVTAVIVAHDGARWLPRLLRSLENQVRLPDRLVAVDTGSRDETAQMLSQTLGPDAVVTAERGLSYGAAVARGLAHLGDGTAPAGQSGDLGFEPGVDHWVWLLHDDMQLDPDALQNLLGATGRDPAIALVGPKVREWPQRKRLLEVGLTVTGTARRLTGVDSGEYDQGQHDRARDTLAVGSAGMLIRRRVWDDLGGFDADLPIFADDLDLGWRAAKAGMRTVVSPDAVVYHAEAGARGQRSIDAARGRAHRLARKHVLFTVLANCRAWAVPLLTVRLVLGSVLRALGMLLLKAPREAWDELAAVGSVLLAPGRMWRARRRRRRLPRSRKAEVRRLLPAWWAPYGQGLELTGQVVAEAIEAVGERSRRAGPESETGPVAEEAQNLTFEPGALTLMLRAPMAIATLVLTLLSLVVSSDLLFGAGVLQGGALLPSPPAAADWWRTYAESWHPVGLGSDIAAPPYVVVLGAFGTLLLGKAWLVIGILFAFSAPLTALAGYVFIKRVVRSRPVAVWAAVTYGLLPLLTGAVAQGRLGTVAAAVVLPLVGRCALALAGPVSGWRTAAGTGLLLAVLAAFVPLALPITVVLAVTAWLGSGGDDRLLRRMVGMLGVAVLLLLPWLLYLGVDLERWTHGEAGYAAGVTGDLAVPGWELALGRPGGPGGAPVWLYVGLVLGALVALGRTDRRGVVLPAWFVGVVGLGFVVLQVYDRAWPGFAVLLVQAAAVVAAAAVADGAWSRLAGASFGWQQPLVAVVAIAALVAPLLGVGWWLFGQGQPLLRRDSPVPVPAFMADSQQTPQAPRTLLLTAEPGGLSASLSRGPGLFIGQDAVVGEQPEQLNEIAARLVTEPTAADVAALAETGVGYVLLSGSSEAAASATAAVDGAPGLVRSSSGSLPGTAWELDAPAGPVRVAAESAAPAAAEVLDSQAGAVDTTVPSLSNGRLSLGEQAGDGWQATLDGEDLEPTVVDGWGQGFALPARSGHLVVEHESGRIWWLAFQGAVLLVALVLVLPGRRRTDETH
jgi:GT2 family glycosyltransferase